MLVELEEFLSQLNSLRTHKKFCDVIFIVDDEKFYAHRAVLVANVEYFNVMFSDNYAERNNLEISLEGISRVGFKFFLDFIYCYDVKLDRASVKDVLTVSLYYNTDSLTNKCFDFIKTYINANNVLEYYEFADSLSYDPLKSYARSFLIRNLKRNTVSLDDILEDNSLITLKNFITFTSTSEVASNALRNLFNGGDVEQQGEFNRLFEIFRNVCSSSDFSEIYNLISIKKNIYVFNKRSPDTIVPWLYDGRSMKHLPRMELKLFDTTTVRPVSHDGKVYLFTKHTDNSNFHYYCTTKDRWTSTNSRFLNGRVHQLASSDFYNSIYLNVADFSFSYSSVLDANIYYYKVDLDDWFQCKISGYATADNEKIFGASLVSYRNYIYSCGGISINRGTLNDTLMLDNRANQWIRKSDTPEISFKDRFNPIAVLDDRLYLWNCQSLCVYDVRADKWLKSRVESDLKINYLIPYQNTLYGIDHNCLYFNIYNPVSDDWKKVTPFGKNLDGFCGALVV